MNVRELIQELEKVEDKELEVFIYYSGDKDLSCEGGNLAYIQMVDDTLGNRVDINCTD